MSLAESMLPEFDDEMARTRAVLAVIPADKMDWQAAESLRSIGWNANHLAEIVGWTHDILDQSEFDIAPVDGPAYETPAMSDPVQIVAKFDDALAAARSALINTPDEQLDEDWTMKMGGQPLFTMTKGDCIRKWVLNHTVHHRGILSVYLRMQGVEVTPVYDS